LIFSLYQNKNFVPSKWSMSTLNCVWRHCLWTHRYIHNWYISVHWRYPLWCWNDHILTSGSLPKFLNPLKVTLANFFAFWYKMFQVCLVYFLPKT
jgi:hypothetical protein